LRIHFDACALNRLSDDQSQPRVIAEAEAVEQILRMVIEGRVEWSASIALHRELGRNPDHEKRHDSLALLSHAGPLLESDAKIIHRANDLAGLGYGTYDALHLAFAEADHADVLITTDDRFLKRASRGGGSPLVRVMNPVSWIEEVRNGSIGSS
jgi:predicted nucleic acid-binding protein